MCCGGTTRLTRRAVLRGTLGVVVVAVVSYFFARSLARNWASLRDDAPEWGWWIAAVVVLFAAAVTISALWWGRIVSRLAETRVGPAEAIRVHFASWLLKYVPGQAGFVVNKVAWAKGRGISRVAVLLSIIYENAFLMIASLVPMTAVLLVAHLFGAGEFHPSQAVWVTLVAALAIAVVIHPRIFHAGVNVLSRRTVHREVSARYFLPTRTSATYTAAYLVPRLINGVGIALIASVTADASAGTWLPLTAAYAIAGAMGILAVFVPSGLGVRESVFVLLAAPFLSVEDAIVVALTARVLSTVADAVIAAGYGMLALGARRKGERS